LLTDIDPLFIQGIILNMLPKKLVLYNTIIRRLSNDQQ